MSDFAKMNKFKETMYVGMTSKMLKAGKTLEEIASETKQPIQMVNRWIELIKKAEENRKTING